MLPWLQIYYCFVMRDDKQADDKQADIIDAFNTTSRYLDDILYIDNYILWQ